jgi:trigger factor
MQVSVELTSELSRKMTVSIPTTVLEDKINSRLKSLARDVKIDGFRPGRAPAKIVAKLYGDRVKGEVTGDLIESTYFEALKQEKLNPVAQPQIVPAEGEGLVYVAEFEVYPEISLDGLQQIKITRPVAEVSEADVDAMIEKLRVQQARWKAVERPSQLEDQLTINFSGVVNGENFTNGVTENMKVLLGGKQMIPGFEEELLGLSVGANKTFSIAFPADYHNTKLAGQLAEFTIDVVSVEERELPEIDAEFMQAYGIADADPAAFRLDVRESMERELLQGLKNKLKTNVLDSLLAEISIALPNALVGQEIQAAIQPYAARAQQMGVQPDLQAQVELFEQQARRRVALGLILGEIIQKHGIKVDADRVRQFVEDAAKSYESPEDVVNWYYSDVSRLNDVQQLVLEDLAVEWVVNQAEVNDATFSFSEVMDKQQIEA